MRDTTFDKNILELCTIREKINRHNDTKKSLEDELTHIKRELRHLEHERKVLVNSLKAAFKEMED